ncbi:hypothetical protein D3C85_1079190 [compost metagenome]
MLWATIEPWAALTGLLIDVPTELGSDHHLIAERGHAFAENPLHLMGAIRLGRIIEGDAVVEGGANDVVHLRPVRDRRLVGATHVLHAQAHTRYFQGAELAPADKGSGLRRFCRASSFTGVRRHSRDQWGYG